MSIITIGIDLAKHIFAVHGVNESGRAELVKPNRFRHRAVPMSSTAQALNRMRTLRRKLQGWQERPQAQNSDARLQK